MRPTSIAAAALVALALPLTSQQCFQQDGLSGPCCAQANPNLPPFPAVSLPGAGVVFDACVPSPKTCMKVELSAPVATGCTSFVTNLSSVECETGASIGGGAVRLDYTRTFGEVTAGGQNVQVWRFLAKVDLSAAPLAGEPFPVPTCLDAYSTAFFYGYVDYARSCATGEWSAAAVLYHACDEFVHDPVLSDHPGVFHPEESYAFVMPDSAANPFVPGIAPAPGGAIAAEAMRDLLTDTGAQQCLTEDRIVDGSLIPLGSACLCPLSFASPQLTASHMHGHGGACLDPLGNPSRFRSLNVYGPTPWFELVSFSIGAWTTNASYPGPERIWADEGLFEVHDACATQPGLAPGNSIEIHYGASTAGGFDVQPIGEGGGPISKRFVDLASNFSHRTGFGMPVQPPVLGSVKATEHLIYVNLF